MLNTIKNIFLNGLNSVAPTELNSTIVRFIYYDIAPMEQKFVLENRTDQLVYQLYDLTEEEIKIIEIN